MIRKPFHFAALRSKVRVIYAALARLRTRIRPSEKSAFVSESGWIAGRILVFDAEATDSSKPLIRHRALAGGGDELGVFGQHSEFVAGFRLLPVGFA